MFIIINSFDRSGGSMFAKLLAKHNDIECLFQPFNNSVFRRKLFEYWDDDIENIEANELVNNVLNGNWSKEIINTPWFHKHSSSFVLSKDKNYVVKTTNLHLKYKWFEKHYPEIKMFSLVRNPLSIMASLTRNGFMGSWYTEKEFLENIELVKESHQLFPKKTLEFGLSLKSVVEKTAFIISINNYVMIKESQEGRVIYFEQVLKNIKEVTNGITNCLGVEDYDYSPYTSENFNVIGDNFQHNSQWESVYNKEEMKNMINIFNFFGGLGYEY